MKLNSKEIHKTKILWKSFFDFTKVYFWIWNTTFMDIFTLIFFFSLKVLNYTKHKRCNGYHRILLIIKVKSVSTFQIKENCAHQNLIFFFFTSLLKFITFPRVNYNSTWLQSCSCNFSKKKMDFYLCLFTLRLCISLHLSAT